MIAMLSVLMVGAGIALGTFGVATQKTARTAALQELLENELNMVTPTKSPQELSGIMERAGAFTDKALDRTPYAERFRLLLLRGDSDKTAGEFGGLLAFSTLVVAVLVFLLSKSPIFSIAALVLIPFVSISRLRRRAAKRIIKLESQLPELLQLVAGSLDSGTSLLVAMELAAQEGDQPLAMELSRVVSESAVGRPLLEALDAMAARIGSTDISWTAKAIRIQHQTGGRLADTLRVLAEFMHARVEVRGEVRSLSAEARISGKVLIAMPICIGLLFYTTRRSYIEPMLSTPGGHMLLGVAFTGIMLGHLWMKKMCKVEV